MVYRCILSFLFLVLSSSLLAAQHLSAPAGIGTTTKPHTVVYKLKPQSGNQLRMAAGNPMQKALQKVGAKSVEQKFPDKAPSPFARKAHVDLSLIYELKHDPSHNLEAVQQALLATGMVEYVEPLYERVPLYQPNDPSADSTKTSQAYLKNIQAYGAWAIQKGDTNIIIGILDTGFRLTHEDIRQKIKYNYDDPVDGIDNDGDGLIDNFFGWDFADRDNNPDDDSPYRGHGAGVAGAAIGHADNGVGIAGVGFNTKFLPIKVFPSTEYGSFGGYEAIVYAADKGCSIINLSWGGEGSSKFEQDIINYAALDRDVVIVAACGNTNAKVNIYPAAYENVLSVGGTNNDVKTSGQTWNYKVDVTAPSSGIYTTAISRDDAYSRGYGTSYASPQVAGAAALLRSQLPHLNAVQVIERLRATSDNIYHLSGNASYFELLGRGRLNVKRALRDIQAKSVRCTSFSVVDNKVAQIGDTLLIHLSMMNYLDPTTALKLTLTSTSPFIKVLDDNELNIGAMGTLATSNNHSKPFRFVVLPDAPHNAQATFRVGFADGAYQDFQYFQLPVNPDYLMLTANNLHVTLTSKGNLGYNGYNFGQGIGITYKGGTSMIFEGGLMVAAAPDRISDNVRNASWQTDNDFVSVKSARLRHNTEDADQEISGVMRDKFPAPAQAGVQVSYKGMAWSESPDADYIILEYRIRNVTPDTIETLHAGLFADWNITDAYMNVADWDETLKMGYVYNMGQASPYAGISLLSVTPPSYYAIDNLSGGSSTFAIADGFSTQEKNKALSGGVARKKAWGSGYGNDVAHVVGTTANKLAPGQSQLVSFAIVAGDDLEHLQQNARAALTKYQVMKAGPAPLAIIDTVCVGASISLAPAGGKQFKFFADEAKTKLLGAGSNFKITALDTSTILYVCNADSLFDSPLVPFQLVVANSPIAGFSIVQPQEQMEPGKSIDFRNESEHGSSWRWNFGNGDTSTEQHPSYTYELPGNYDVSLIVSNSSDCGEDTVTRRIEIKQVETIIPAPPNFLVYPNPAVHELHIALPKADAPLILFMTDAMGRRVSLKLRSRMPHEAIFDLNGLAEGFYIVQLTYENNTTTSRLLIIRP
ncbi:subtilisin family serine protease [Pontibacter sp. HSC-36F09]|nr:subtilisin family serine protease [Pontibacter sp. HSC-36F09]